MHSFLDIHCISEHSWISAARFSSVATILSPCQVQQDNVRLQLSAVALSVRYIPLTSKYHFHSSQQTDPPLSSGKSSLSVQYVAGHFVESYYPTIESTFSRVIRYKNQDYATEIIDTAGQDEYSILNSKHFIGIHGYLLVYSVASKQSFEMVRIIREKILNHLVRPLLRVPPLAR